MTTGTFAPATVAAASKLTAAQWNADVRDNLATLGAAWTAYSPSIVPSATPGSFTCTTNRARYRKLGKTVDVCVDFTVTVNSTGSIALYVFLPVNCAGVFAAAGYQVTAGLAMAAFGTPAGQLISLRGYNGSYPAADGRQIVVSATYEAA